jgi:hypothetical protein
MTHTESSGCWGQWPRRSSNVRRPARDPSASLSWRCSSSSGSELSTSAWPRGSNQSPNISIEPSSVLGGRERTRRTHRSAGQESDAHCPHAEARGRRTRQWHHQRRARLVSRETRPMERGLRAATRTPATVLTAQGRPKRAAQALVEDDQQASRRASYWLAEIARSGTTPAITPSHGYDQSACHCCLSRQERHGRSETVADCGLATCWGSGDSWRVQSVREARLGGSRLAPAIGRSRHGVPPGDASSSDSSGYLRGPVVKVIRPRRAGQPSRPAGGASRRARAARL